MSLSDWWSQRLVAWSAWLLDAVRRPLQFLLLLIGLPLSLTLAGSYFITVSIARRSCAGAGAAARVG